MRNVLAPRLRGLLGFVRNSEACVTGVKGSAWLVLVLLSRGETPEGGRVAVVVWCALRRPRASVPASAMERERSVSGEGA